MIRNEVKRSPTDGGPEVTDAEAAGEPESPSSAGSERLPRDIVFELLKNQRRRDALRYLEEHGGEATLSDLTEHIAAKENDTTVEALSSSQRKRVYIALYQSHLPKMADAGVIGFDKNRGDVELRPPVEQLDPYLAGPDDGLGSSDDGPAPDARRATRHLALAVAVGLCVTAGLLDFPVFSLVSDAGWAVISTLSLVILAGAEGNRYSVG